MTSHEHESDTHSTPAAHPQHKPAHHRRRSVRFVSVLVSLAFAVVFWSIAGILAVLAVGWFVGISLGYNTYSDTTTDMQDVQIAFWITLWCGLIFTFIWRWLKHIKGTFWHINRRVLLVFLVLGVIGGLVGSTIGYVVVNRDTTNCDLSKTLNTAIGATYPLEVTTASGTAYGTAFAVDGNGSLVTAYHVIEGAQTVYVNYASGKVPVSIVKASADHDTALLKYPQPTPDYLKLVTDSTIGDQVYAVGYPGNTFTAGQASVSTGIVSRVIEPSDVQQSNDAAPPDLAYIQTDAAINPGNSGGPLIDQCGAVGMVEAVSDSAELHRYNLPVSEQNISYAVSAQTIKSALGL